MPQLRIPYYSKDYNSIKTEAINRIKSQLKGRWTDFSENDFGIILLELFASIADLTNFNIDNNALESFLETARKRKNVARIASQLGHSLEPRQAGMTKVSVSIVNPLSTNFTIPKGTKFKTAGTSPKFFTTNENFVIPSTSEEKRSCKFSIITNSGSTNITDVALVGIDIPNNTDGAILYAKLQLADSKNKIALYKSSSRTGALDNTADDDDKVAYGEVASGSYEVTLSEVNSSGISGKIYIGSSNLPSSVDTGEELHIDGPTCYEGELVTEVFTSNGTIDQRFDLTNPIQKIPSSSTKTVELTVNSVAWTEVEDMFFEQQNYFIAETIEQEYSTLVFGDGDSGNIPTNGATISVTYVKGNGEIGHTGAGKITSISDVLLNGGDIVLTQQYNIEPTIGASDEEELSVAKKNALNSFKNRSRMVTGDDYESLIKTYFEENQSNIEIVQAWKDETEPDLINELEIYVLSRETEGYTAGRPKAVTIDLTTDGGLWSYVADRKTLPEGIRKADGTSGFSNGTLDASSAAFYYTVYKRLGDDREGIREAVRKVIIDYFHALDFQEGVNLFSLSKDILDISGVQNIQFFTDSGRTTDASNVSISSSSDRGKILVLPEAFYTVGEKVYLKVDGD